MNPYTKFFLTLVLLFLSEFGLWVLYDVTHRHIAVLILMIVVVLSMIYVGITFNPLKKRQILQKKGTLPNCLYCGKEITSRKDFLIASVTWRAGFNYDTYHQKCHKQAFTTTEGYRRNIINFYTLRMGYSPEYIKKISTYGYLYGTGMSIVFYPTGIYFLNRIPIWVLDIVILTFFLVALPLQGQLLFGIFWSLIIIYHAYVLIKTNKQYLHLLR